MSIAHSVFKQTVLNASA